MSHTHTLAHCHPGPSSAAGCLQVSVIFVESLIAQVSRKWLLRVWLANELPGRGSVVSRSITGPCSLIKVTYLWGKNATAWCDDRRKRTGKWNERSKEKRRICFWKDFEARQWDVHTRKEPHSADKSLLDSGSSEVADFCKQQQYYFLFSDAPCHLKPSSASCDITVKSSNPTDPPPLLWAPPRIICTSHEFLANELIVRARSL